MSRRPYRGGSIPGGHIVGRVSGGTGQAELIPLSELNYHTAAFGGGAASGAGTGISTPINVASGGTGLASGTSGGIPAYTGSTTMTSSGVLATNSLVLGGGAAAVPATDSDWTIASHVLKGNLSGLTLPAGPAGTIVQLGQA